VHYRGSGKGRAKEAATAAISSPLLDFPIERARGVVFNIVGGDDLTLQEVMICVLSCRCVILCLLLRFVLRR
jgi:cell division GTPase FtsZ